MDKKVKPSLSEKATVKNHEQITLQTEATLPYQNWLKRQINSPVALIGLAIVLVTVLMRPKSKRKITGFPHVPSKSLLDPKEETVKQPTTSVGDSFRAVPGKAVTSDEALDMLEDSRKKFIIVGGKGGVGKTSMSSALATKYVSVWICNIVHSPRIGLQMLEKRHLLSLRILHILYRMYLNRIFLVENLYK